MLDLETLKLFIAVAEHGSFTRAAIKLGMTQPTISKRIQQLEEEIGGPLLYRHGRGVNLTDVGARLAEVARSVLLQLDKVKVELDDRAQQLRGWVTIGLPPSFSSTLSLPLARRFQKCFPDAKLRIVEALSGSMLEQLEAGTLDLGVLYDARISPTMPVSPLLLEDLYLIESGLIPGSDEPAEVTELTKGPFVLASSSNGLRRVIDSVAALASLEIDITFEIDSLTGLKRIVEHGPERCVLPYGAVHREVSEGKLRARPFVGRGLTALLVSAMPLHRPVPRLIRELKELLVDEVDISIKNKILSGTRL